jgi:hypothetical protein
VERVTGLGQGEEQDAGLHGRELKQPELQRRDDPEAPAATAQQLREWVQGRITTVLSGELALVHTRLGPVVEAAGVLSPSPLTPTTFLDLRDALA